MSSAFNPIVPALPRETHDDRLARFVPAALRRTPPVAKVWPPLRMIVIGFATAGLLPFWPLRKRVGQTLVYHARQCELTVDTIGRFLPAGDLAELRSAAAGVNVRHAGLNVAAAFWCAGVICFGQWLTHQPYWAREVWPLLAARSLPTTVVGLAGMLLLCFAYFAVIARINAQCVRMQQFALAFNAVCGERFGDVDPPPLVWGVRPIHLLLGGVAAWLGPVWLLPMAMAWAAHGTFSWGVGSRFRTQLADRLVRATGVDPVVPTGDLCPNPDCRECVPADARFCRRCGGPVNQ